jgi:hypothetical protein
MVVVVELHHYMVPTWLATLPLGIMATQVSTFFIKQ